MNKKIFVGVIAFLAVVIFGAIFINLKDTDGGAESIATAEASAEIEETTHNWGEIGISNGNVEKVFDIKNEGTEALMFYGVTTSCMCTTAQLTLDEESSPIFGMQDNSNYVLEVPPGKTAKMKVVFDPAYHGPSGVGEITREVIIKTNDINNPEINFMLTASVVR